MKARSPLFVALALILGFLLPSSAHGATRDVTIAAEVLSDTRGADLVPYLQALTTSLHERWLKLAGDAANDDAAESRETTLDTTLNEDGEIVSLTNQGMSHDEAWAKIAWDATKGNVFPALPPKLKGTQLRLRLHFRSKS